MGRLRKMRALAALAALASAAALAQPVFDIGTGGNATITGTLNGSVTVNPSQRVLQVAVDFGELSPVNRNPMVRVSIPVTVRSEAAYQVVAQVASSGMSASPDGMQLSDVGIGIINVRPLSAGQICTTPHTVYPPFNADPALTALQTPRVAYPGNLSLLANPRVVMTGPTLSSRRVNLNNPGANGWSFDLVLTVAPQFFVPGSSTATLVLTISQGPNTPC